MSRINTTIHDTFIRAILSDKNIAIEYFRNYLPEAVSSKLDFSSMKQIPDTYISKNLQKTMSDIVYSCSVTGQKNDIIISLLIEHKSFPDKFTAIQIGSYLFSGYEKQIKNKEPLSLIIPILLYHGRGKWKYQPLSGLFKNLNPEWKQFIPDFDYVYNNLGEISDEQVEALQNKFLVASLLSLKHSFEKKWLEGNALKILILSDEASENLQRNLADYIFANSSMKEHEIIELTKSLPSNIKNTLMSTLDLLEKRAAEKGLQKGIEQGIEQGIELGKADIAKNLLINTDFTIDQIATLTGVQEQMVQEIRNKLNSGK